MKTLKLLSLCLISGIIIISSCDNKQISSQDALIEKKIDSLISLMTLKEKAGQLTIYGGECIITGPTLNLVPSSERYDSAIRIGEVSGLLGVFGVDYVTRIQKIAVEESRLGIPLIIGTDVIHGYKTTFPIPLAMASSWDLNAIEKSSRIAAEEASAAGVNWTYAPMVDISRDPRWGRIAESSGEDVYLDCEVAKAQVRGFQGEDLSLHNTIMACPKHFVAYGASMAGRDYNEVDISENALRNIYLPPFKAALDEGAMSIMTSFNELNGIPTTANKYLCDQILRNEWGFKGLVVSDFVSILELMNHGVASDRTEAAKLALEAGTDIDMHGEAFIGELPALVEQGKVNEKMLDEAVRRVLRCKYKLGLFDNPFLYCNEEREKTVILSDSNLQYAREMGKKSMVLLKNDKQILPLAKSGISIALVGPFASNKGDMNGMWSFFSDPEGPVTFLEGIKNKVGSKARVQYAKGCNVRDGFADDYNKAVQIAKTSDVIVACLGESIDMNGEAASRTDIGLPGKQLEFLKKLKSTGKPIVLVLTNGRPLTLEWENENVDAILETWSLGTEAGNAFADVLFGDYNPSGKLTVSFPRNVGQIPLYYSHKNVGRPENDTKYSSKYLDSPNDPLYPFGYGLSYTTFEYSNLQISSDNISFNDTLRVTVTVKNTGKVEGEEIVQLYIQDVVGSIKRPVKELKRFAKINIKPAEEKEIIFNLTAGDFKFYNKGKYFAETGKFIAYVGKNSEDTLEKEFELVSN